MPMKRPAKTRPLLTPMLEAAASKVEVQAVEGMMRAQAACPPDMDWYAYNRALSSGLGLQDLFEDAFPYSLGVPEDPREDDYRKAGEQALNLIHSGMGPAKAVPEAVHHVTGAAAGALPVLLLALGAGLYFLG